PNFLRFRLASLPKRIKLSIPNTSKSGDDSLIRRASALPTNPQIPVTKTFMEANARPTKRTNHEYLSIEFNPDLPALKAAQSLAEYSERRNQPSNASGGTDPH